MIWFYADKHKTWNWQLIIIHILLFLKITSEQHLYNLLYMCLSPWWFFMTINTPSLEDFWLIYTESLFSLEIGTETMFQTDLYQSSLSVYKVNNVAPSKGLFQTLQRKYHSFGLFDKFQDSTKFGSIKHYFNQLLSWNGYYTYFITSF